MNKNDLLHLINESPITLIGYSFRDERVKDELISNLNYLDVGIIDWSFSFKSFIRDFKINCILSDSDFILPEYIIVDVNNIDIHRDNSLLRANKIQSFIQDSLINNLKTTVIITSPINKHLESGYQTTNFSGGNRLLYFSSLALSIDDYKVKVIKNRAGVENTVYNLMEE